MSLNLLFLFEFVFLSHLIYLIVREYADDLVEARVRLVRAPPADLTLQAVAHLGLEEAHEAVVGRLVLELGVVDGPGPLILVWEPAFVEERLPVALPAVALEVVLDGVRPPGPLHVRPDVVVSGLLGRSTSTLGYQYHGTVLLPTGVFLIFGTGGT